MRVSKLHGTLVLALCLVAAGAGFSPSTNNKSARISTHLYQEATEARETQKRQPWDVLRFINQSSKFITFPSFGSTSSSKRIVKPGEVLWQPSSSRSFQWAPLDDVVMGGASRSDIDNKSGLWKGLVTDANSGGFVGIRSVKDLKLDLTNCQGLEFTFQSSPIMPTRLKVVLRDSTDFNGIAWTSSVDVPKSGGNNIKNKQVRVKLPLNKPNSLVPTKFAQIINDDSVKEGINKSSITALQLVYSKFEYEGALNPKFVAGDFELQVLEVKAY